MLISAWVKGKVQNASGVTCSKWMTLFYCLLSLLTIFSNTYELIWGIASKWLQLLLKKAVSVSNQKLLKASPSSLLLVILLLARKLAHSKLQDWSCQHIKLECYSLITHSKIILTAALLYYQCHLCLAPHLLLSTTWACTLNVFEAATSRMEITAWPSWEISPANSQSLEGKE